MPKQLKKKKALTSAEWGRIGGLEGGKIRAKNLSAKRRLEIARKAAAARIAKSSPEQRSELARKAAAARMEKISPERRREIALKASHSRRKKK